MPVQFVLTDYRSQLMARAVYDKLEGGTHAAWQFPPIWSTPFRSFACRSAESRAAWAARFRRTRGTACEAFALPPRFLDPVVSGPGAGEGGEVRPASMQAAASCP